MNLIKEKIYNIWKYVKNPEKAVCNICTYDNYKFAKFVPDRLFLKCFFRKHMQEKLNLNNPRTFSEKLQWLKLYDRNPQYNIMADKAAVKDYVSSILGDKFIIPTLGLYTTAEDIPFNDLPEKFVIKCTHDSGSVFICDKRKGYDINEIKASLTQSLKTDFYWYGREWAYKNIKPMIIVEEFISDENGNCPVDYKFFCFDGKMEIFKIDYNRFTKRAANYYDKNCNFMKIGKVNSTPDPTIKLELPANFREMVEVTERLSKGIPFLRVDLYSINNHIYFGELTFYPSSGVEPFIGDGDIIMGDMLKLPNTKNKGVKL